MSNPIHLPILTVPIVDFFLETIAAQNQDAVWIVDCTVGSGGHALALAKALPANVGFILIDQDPTSLEISRKRWENERDTDPRLIKEVVWVCLNFGDLTPETLRSALAGHIWSDRPVVGILADLGYSSDQLEDVQRGLSFMQDGPLDMRLSPDTRDTAYHLLSTRTRPEIERVIREFGEENFAGRITRVLMEARSSGQLPKTTGALVSLISSAVPSAYRHGRIHPATRTFQALRIWVNSELENLEKLLSHAKLLLSPGGRLAVISFHSLEDRFVKRAFQDRQDWRPLTKKPLMADADEVEMNPRARSAKLRCAVKC